MDSTLLITDQGACYLEHMTACICAVNLVFSFLPISSSFLSLNGLIEVQWNVHTPLSTQQNPAKIKRGIISEFND